MALDARASLEIFLNTIWKSPPNHEDGYWVYVPTIKRETGEWRKAFYPWNKGSAKIIAHILSSSAQGKDVYISPVLWKKPALERADVLGSWVVWSDFDGNAPTSWPEQVNAATAESSVPGAPSIRIQSSNEGHEHVYWLLDEFATNLQWIEDTNRSIAYSHEADVSGWDYTQLLRPPATTNFGKTNKQLPVLVASLDLVEYPVDAFRNLTPVAEVINSSIADADIIELVDIVAKYRIEQDNLELIRKDSTELLDRDRSGAMMRIAYHCAELGMQDVEIYSVLYYLDEKWEKFKKRRDRKKRLLDIVNKAKLRYPQAVAALEVETFLQPNEGIERDLRTVFGFKDLLVADFKIEWLVKDLIAERTVGVISSAPGKGKTQFLMNLAMHCALGKMFLDYEVIVPHRSMFFSLEMGPELLKHFVETMSPAYTEEEQATLQSNFLMIPAGQQMPLIQKTKDRNQGQLFIEEMIETYNPKVIYIDSMARIIPGKFADEDVIELYGYFSKLRAKYGVSVVIIHHNRKAQGDNKRPKNLEDLYGSQYIGGESDWIATLFPETPDNSILEVNEVKNRLAQHRPAFHVRRTEHLGFEIIRDFRSSLQEGGAPLGRLLERTVDSSVLNNKQNNPFE